MENYTITKEQILRLSLRDQIVEELLNEWFPNAFKKEMKVEKWYKGIKHNFLVNYQGNDGINYGFWGNSGFKNDIFFGEYWVDECREATDEEVEEALIAEANKRGYKKGVKCVFGKAEEKRRLETDDFKLSTDNELCVKRFNSTTSDIIFKDGKWAEIITEETKVITMDKAVKILSKKYGKQVEIK